MGDAADDERRREDLAMLDDEAERQERRDAYSTLMTEATAAESEGLEGLAEQMKASAIVVLESDKDHAEKLRQLRGLQARVSDEVAALVKESEEEEPKQAEPAKLGLPTAPTKPRRTLSDTSTLLYGPPKCGKTTVAADIPGHIILRTEQGQKHIEHFGMDCPNWTEVKRAVGLLARMDHDFKVIVIDTIDSAIDLCRRHVCRELDIKDPADLDYGKGFGAVNEEWRKFLQFISNIPMGLLMLSHAKLHDIPDKEGGGTRWTPSAKGGPGRAVLAMVDSIFFVEVHRDGTSQVRTRANTTGVGEFVAGSRMAAMADPIPFSWDGFENALTTALAGKGA